MEHRTSIRSYEPPVLHTQGTGWCSDIFELKIKWIKIVATGGGMHVHQTFQIKIIPTWDSTKSENSVIEKPKFNLKYQISDNDCNIAIIYFIGRLVAFFE